MERESGSKKTENYEIHAPNVFGLNELPSFRQKEDAPSGDSTPSFTKKGPGSPKGGPLEPDPPIGISKQYEKIKKKLRFRSKDKSVAS